MLPALAVLLGIISLFVPSEKSGDSQLNRRRAVMIVAMIILQGLICVGTVASVVVEKGAAAERDRQAQEREQLLLEETKKLRAQVATPADIQNIYLEFRKDLIAVGVLPGDVDKPAIVKQSVAAQAERSHLL